MQGGNPPKNCMYAFSADGDQVYTNRVWTAEQNRANVLFGDVAEEIGCATRAFCLCLEESSTR